ncbi:EthD domain-containing protein [Paraburkholderia youngii]|uniref:EthD domain-containing protein n=1 Tax=Paraburkholderia youngii TaxID=2782701 RepID=UPI003D206477
MIKRMTLLSRKQGSSVSDFRAYWSGCHAQLALCMNGISSYMQNRVDKTLWQFSDDSGHYDIDGVVELCFESDAVMDEAQRSSVGSEHIPNDEPNFLRGWTLCVVEHEDEPTAHAGVKVIVAATMRDSVSRADFRQAIVGANLAQREAAALSFDWTQKTAKRERLWAEPVTPTVLASLWFGNVAQAHDAFRPDDAFAQKIGQISTRAAALLIDPLVIR